MQHRARNPPQNQDQLLDTPPIKKNAQIGLLRIPKTPRTYPLSILPFLNPLQFQNQLPFPAKKSRRVTMKNPGVSTVLAKIKK